MKTALNGEQMVWPSVNLYDGSTVAISFTDNFGNAIACTNTVTLINLVPRTDPGGEADFWRFPAVYGTI
jgi:hypothetical protein